jgi:nitronate monooxygenase
MVLDELEVPIVLAPLAGGPATVDLAAAVCDAGGLGFLAAGYRTPDALASQMAELRSRTSRPFGVNVFAPLAGPAEPDSYAGYVERLAARHGTTLGEPRHDDDGWEAKLALLREQAPPVVSFVFGCPPAGVIAALRERGSSVWVTVTSLDEASAALAAGADALVAQGYEAGGHRGGFADDDAAPPLGLLALLQLLAARTDSPLVAAGGIASGRGVAAVLAAGASAAAVGTGFLRTPEAGTSAPHRAALATDAPTALTRAFTGRSARGIVNEFMRDHGADAPRAYPEIHHVTAPLRQAARERGDAELVNLWAGQAHALAPEAPAAEVVARLVAEAREALESARARLRR